VECFHLQRIVSATIAATMRRNFSLRDSHGGTCSLKYQTVAGRPSRSAGIAQPMEGRALPGLAMDSGGARYSGFRATCNRKRRSGWLRAKAAYASAASLTNALVCLSRPNVLTGP
jgi:hypothetical protein